MFKWYVKSVDISARHVQRYVTLVKLNFPQVHKKQKFPQELNIPGIQIKMSKLTKEYIHQHHILMIYKKNNFTGNGHHSVKGNLVAEEECVFQRLAGNSNKMSK